MKPVPPSRDPVPLPPFRRLLRMVGIDRAIGYTVLARGWASAAGLVTVALIAKLLTREEQGFYYTFGSLVAMQLIFELGFSVVILQMATHEAAHLTISTNGSITGEARPHARLASILRKAVKWYTLAAFLMAVALVPIGWKFFSVSPGAHDVGWKWPWICVVLASSVTFQIDPIFSFLEGCGQVVHVARTRLTQSLTGAVLAWGALLLHHGLFAPALLISGQAGAGLYFLFRRRRMLMSLFRHDVREHAVDWGVEVWPFQWRIAVSYASGFFIFQLFNPVLLHYWGPAVAGQMGMSLQISTAIASVGIAWINTKAAPFGAMIAHKEYARLDSVFFRAASQAVAICTFGAVLMLAVRVLMARQNHLLFAERLLPSLPFGMLLATMICNQVVASMAMYLRAHKQEKFLLNSVLGAIAVSVSTYFLGRRFGPVGMTAGHLGSTLVIGLGLGTWTFVKYRRLWHAS